MIAVRTSSPYAFGAVAVLAAAIALLPGPAAAQMWGKQKITGSGVVKTDARNVIGFHSVVLAVPANAHAEPGQQ